MDKLFYFGKLGRKLGRIWYYENTINPTNPHGMQQDKKEHA